MIAIILLSIFGDPQEQWRGLTIAPENRCSEYRLQDYRHRPSVERWIIRRNGRYWPYTGRYFRHHRQSDIEHIISKSEAHDSGMCARSKRARFHFSNDINNMVSAHPHTNRRLKRGKDAAEWMPVFNRCWFAAKNIEIRRKWRLTIDQAEADAIDRVLATCDSTEMIRRR